MRPVPVLVLAATLFLAATIAAARAQGRDGFMGKFTDPVIDYYGGPLNDPVAELNRRVRDGSVTLAFDDRNGYLQSVLQALHVPVESQVALFSETSLQSPLIKPGNPRAIFFNDTVAVGWVRGGVLELAAQDPRQGTIFYALEQKPARAPQFERSTECLRCHVTWETLGVPGIFVLSTGPDDASGYATGGIVDHRNRLSERWGGWYVTGTRVPPDHMGNLVYGHPPPGTPRRAAAAAPALTSLDGKFDLAGYPTPYSDVVALMVLEHQTHLMNLLTYIGWEARVGADRTRLDGIARDLVDYLLFVNEAPLPGGRIEGSSGFAKWFTSQGPRDRKGRSLRDFDLEHRLMRYPCSYLIYAPSFDALPPAAKDAVYRRMWRVLSGQETAGKYARLTEADRQAVVEILRETKPDLPEYFLAGAPTPRRVPREGALRSRDAARCCHAWPWQPAAR